ncbi:hypothetical protein Cycma_0516 [Cyclobacterium marinum DSM 745]|uniref:Uncharacterized protein n=1 Tax=Cyclobacterium marinum (strain ATCC 25205 / DSM 745 / LMG 13164 / NCIMB 1802) TaxID=880070 RepID=G0IXV8_CYCMS|nr:hypothetical protein Cycma_0516 [Cyclobacterium marinum DSM 745]
MQLNIPVYRFIFQFKLLSKNGFRIIFKGNAAE